MLPFGKYKGQTIEQIYQTDPRYIEWMGQQAQLDLSSIGTGGPRYTGGIVKDGVNWSVKALQFLESLRDEDGPEVCSHCGETSCNGTDCL